MPAAPRIFWGDYFFHLCRYQSGKSVRIFVFDKGMRKIGIIFDKYESGNKGRRNLGVGHAN